MKTLRTLGLGVAIFSLAGCYPYHRHGYGRDRDDAAVDTCLLSACVVNTCLLDSCINGPRRYDDDHRAYHHHHGPQCGCPSRYEYGHYAYYYNGRWEYAD